MMSRTGFFVGYLLLVGLLAWFVGTSAARRATPLVIAARDLPADHYLELADIVAADHQRITHHYLKHGVKRDVVITPTDVSDTAAVKAQANSFAFVLNVKGAAARSMASGSTVQLCKDGNQFAEKVTVVDHVCGADRDKCLLTVAVPQLPKDAASLNDLNKVDVGLPFAPFCPPASKPVATK